MKEIPVKNDGISELGADEFNPSQNELENAVTSSGQTLNENDDFQLSKAMVANATHGDYYTDVGTVNAVGLVPIDANVVQSSIEYGTRVRFKPAFTNTSTVVTLTLGSLASGKLSKYRPEKTGGFYAVPVSDLDVDKIITAVYTASAYGTPTDYWLIDAIENVDLQDGCVDQRVIASASVGTTELINESVTSSKIPDLGVPNAKLAADIQLDKISGGTLDITNATTINNTTLTDSKIELSKFAGAGTEIKKEGVRFYSNSAIGVSANSRWQILDISNEIDLSSLDDVLTRTEDAHSHRVGQNYTFPTMMDTGIPKDALIFGTACLSYTEQATGQIVHGAPAVIYTYRGDDNYEISSIALHHVRSADADVIPDTSYPVYLTIFYDGGSLS